MFVSNPLKSRTSVRRSAAQRRRAPFFAPAAIKCYKLDTSHKHYNEVVKTCNTYVCIYVYIHIYIYIYIYMYYIYIYT